MDKTNRAAVTEHYASLSDEGLLQDFYLGPEAYRDRATWDFIAAEVASRGLRDAREINAVEHTRATAAAAVEAQFCHRCLATTTAESSGSTHITGINFLFWYGDRLLGRSHECPACGSYIARLWIVFGVPLIPLARYRIIDLGDHRFLSRRVVAA